MSRLELDRSQILAFRRRVGALDTRMPSGVRSLREAAWMGLQDSMPRAALLSIHARVGDAHQTVWEDPSLVQVWGPRFSAYVVAARDRAVFTLGRMPEKGKGRGRAEDLATRLHALLDDRRMTYGAAGRELGVNPNELRYAALTGRVVMRWDGARQSVIWMAPPPQTDEGEARIELARRFLHVIGPATPESFATWAGIRPTRGIAAFQELRNELAPVGTPVGDAYILTSDEAALRAAPDPPAPARLLPSGDAYFLLHGADRELLIPDTDRRRELWTPRVWPGALLVDGEIVGIWRRAQTKVTVQAWRRLSAAERDAVDAEAASLPLPDLTGGIVVHWAD